MKIEPGKLPQLWTQKHFRRIAGQSRSGNTILHDVQRVRQYFEVTWIARTRLEDALENWIYRVREPLRHLRAEMAGAVIDAVRSLDPAKRRPTNSEFRSTAMTISAPKAARAKPVPDSLTRHRSTTDHRALSD